MAWVLELDVVAVIADGLVEVVEAHVNYFVVLVRKLICEWRWVSAISEDVVLSYQHVVVLVVPFRHLWSWKTFDALLDLLWVLSCLRELLLFILQAIQAPLIWWWDVRITWQHRVGNLRLWVDFSGLIDSLLLIHYGLIYHVLVGCLVRSTTFNTSMSCFDTTVDQGLLLFHDILWSKSIRNQPRCLYSFNLSWCLLAIVVRISTQTSCILSTFPHLLVLFGQFVHINLRYLTWNPHVDRGLLPFILWDLHTNHFSWNITLYCIIGYLLITNGILICTFRLSLYYHVELLVIFTAVFILVIDLICMVLVAHIIVHVEFIVLLSNIGHEVFVLKTLALQLFLDYLFCITQDFDIGVLWSQLLNAMAGPQIILSS